MKSKIATDLGLYHFIYAFLSNYAVIGRHAWNTLTALELAEELRSEEWPQLCLGRLSFMGCFLGAT